jgi:hypothetical protein
MGRPLPWLFHIPDTELAATLAPYLFEAGALIIADPAHLPEDTREHYVHTVTGPRDDTELGPVLDIHIHAVDWSREVEWLPEELEHVAGDLYAWAAWPTQFIETIEDIPEDAPPGVAAWLDLDDD